MMAQAFQSAGFRTGAFVENPWIHSKYGWAKGFDGFKDVPALYDHQGERWSRLPDATKHTLDFAQEWIDAQGDDAWFCYVHLIRPHDPYDAPVKYTAHYTREPYRDHDHPRAEHRIREAATADPNSVNQDDIDYLTDMYDANLRYVDALVGDFYESLKRQGALDDTLIVLMSDHGEAFGEHGKLGHNTTAYEEMVHVPLAIVAPEGHGFAKGAYSGLVDLVDLMPTFAELYGLSAPARLAGVSLAPALHRRADTGRHHSVSHSAFDHFQVAWREGDLKLIAHVDPNYSEVQSYEVFNLEADPMERHDLSRDESIAGPLLSAVREYLGDIERKDTSGDPTLEPDDLEQLRALGYGKTD
jgi:arylsulfatase A-like enzyme